MRRRKFDRAVVARMRAAAIFALSMVVAVALVQTAAQLYMGVKIPHYDTVIGDSARRELLVERLEHVRPVSQTDLDRLQALELAFDDLTPLELAAFDRFVANPTPQLGAPVAAAFDRLTNEYVERGETTRARLVLGVIAGSVVLLAAAIGLYVIVLVPTVDGVNRVLRSEELQRERLRIVSSLAFARTREVGEKIDETLAFAARSLGADRAIVGSLHNGVLTVEHGAGEGYECGRAFPLAGAPEHAAFGSRDVHVTAKAAATTLYLEDQPAGLVSFAWDAEPERPIGDGDRHFVRIVASFVGNAMERERRERVLNEMAYHDPLTRLPNRAYFSKQLSDAIGQAHRRDDRLCVYYIDLDGFKSVNDEFGHAAGDETLCIVAARLRAAVRGRDIVARVGGDEFVALAYAADGEEGALELGRRFVAAASEPIIIAGKQPHLGASVGIARFPRDAETADELVECADRAMYAAKRGGKNAAVLFEPGLGPAA